MGVEEMGMGVGVAMGRWSDLVFFFVILTHYRFIIQI